MVRLAREAFERRSKKAGKLELIINELAMLSFFVGIYFICMVII